MFKTSIPLKVTIGYILITVILALAIWLVYGNTMEFMKIDKAEREYVERRDVVDSLVYCFLDANNSERAICLRIDEWENFDNSINCALRLTDTLKATANEDMSLKIDTLQSLLLMKRENTKMIMEIMAENNAGKVLNRKVKSLQRGKDSVVIHPDALKKQEDTEIVYEVVKTRKGFFNRLADAFRKQHTDTVSIRQKTKESNDSAKHSINIANDVADALTEIRKEESRILREQKAKIEKRAQQQQIVGVQTAIRIEQLLAEIRTEEHSSLQQAFDEDLKAKQSIILKIIILAIISLLTSVILLYNVWRDARRAERYRESLIRAKNETERLTLTITHDIKAPAASISGFIDLLKDHIDSTYPKSNDAGHNKAMSYLSNIKNSADHLLKMVSALLEYHKIENGKVEIRNISFNAAQLIGSCADSMRPLAEAKGLTLKCEIGSECDILCSADAFRFRQILENIISNAVKYTAEGGISVKAFFENGALGIDVEDTGQGMTEEESQRIFTAFTRLSGAQGIEGVGLGLSITKEFVNLLDGDISVESVKGKGTTFHVIIPVEVLKTEGQKEVAPSEIKYENNAAMTDIGNILIVDDDKLQLQLLQEIIKKISGNSSLSIHACQHTDEAIEAFRNEKPAAFFVDVEMPEMSGTELISKLGSHDDTMLIAMTAHEPSIEPSLKEAGFDYCLFKPIKREDLAKVLNISANKIHGRNYANEDAINIDTSVDITNNNRFANLTAFAEDDEEAAKEILQNFKEDLERHISMLESDPGDRSKIGFVAHKSLPTLSMISFSQIDILKELTPEHINELTDEKIQAYSESILKEMHEILDELTNIIR